MKYLFIFALGLNLAQGEEGPVSFNRDVRPILSENCFYCHGQDGNKREGDLRLDLREAAVASKAIVPGDAAASELVKRLFSTDPDEVMPPPKSNRHVSAAQREILQKWIAQGAPYEAHWTFVAPVRPPLPEVKQKDWPRQAIDHFILARMERAGLAPSPEADRLALVRRVHLDLTGLPPTAEEVTAYLEDAAPDAYERLVDRVLASPHFGERMALPWFDAARYADSNGFQQDGDTHQYFWRDWVIRALNADMPFDRFSIEQLAGDLLPNPTEDQLIATAFNRNHLLNGEGGAIAEEQRNVILFDRVDTTATTWLGLTVACAQCHDHKYDPITARDYYSMFAFFNNVPESGVPSGGGQYRIADPWIAVASPEEKGRLDSLTLALSKAKAAEKDIADAPRTKEAIATTERALSATTPVEWTVLKPAKAEAPAGMTLSVLEDVSLFAEGTIPDAGNYVIELPPSNQAIHGLRLETIPDRRLPAKGAGLSDSGNAVLTKMRVRVGDREWPLTTASASYTQAGFSPMGVIDDNPETAWAFYPETKKPYSLVVQCGEPVPPQTPIQVTLEFQSPHKQHLLGRFRVAATAHEQPTGRDECPDDITAILRKTEDARTPEEKTKLRTYVTAERAPVELVAARRATKDAEGALNDFRQAIPRVMVMSDAKPRETKVLDRGDYLTPTTPVTANTPAFLPPLAPDAPKNRLALAQWLFRPDHPLTARVQVNRLWQYFFATGLVKTSEDLGVQSEMPIHGPLLDWLSVEFREKGWSQKHLIRLLMTSSTYRQSSRVTPALAQADPENRLHARASRMRMPSLVLRDVALAASGLLSRKMGGKPVYPYQPDEVWETLAITKERDFTYPASTGSALYRRSLYTFWRRTVGPVNMFDASPRQACKVRSAVTSTPLHALTTLNDVTWVESARVLAQRTLQEGGDRTAQITWAFRRVLTRSPSSDELARLMAAWEKQHAYFTQQPEASAQFLTVGAAPAAAGLPPIEHAAMTAVCLALFNLDEALTRQ
jgi:hypothetical protein